MPKASPIQTNFTAGELSPLLDGRVDLAKYQNGLKTCLNMLPTVRGPVTRRPGTYYVAPTKTAGDRSRLMPFRPNVVQPYVLEIGDGYVRFFRNEGQITVPDTTASITNSTFASNITSWTDRSTGTGGITWNSDGFMEIDGDGSSNAGWAEQSVSISAGTKDNVHVLAFQVIYVNGLLRPMKLRIGTSSTGNELIDDQEYYPGYHLVSFTPGATTIYVQFIVDNESTATPDWSIGVDNISFLDNQPLEITTPYDIADVYELNHAQSADVLYLAHQSYRTMKLKRLGDRDWSLEEFRPTGGPYQSENTDTTIKVSCNSTIEKGDDVTLTCSGGEIFESDHVGTLIQLREGEGQRDYGLWPGANVNVTTGDQVSWEGRVYEAQNTDQSGYQPPTHEEGEYWDGLPDATKSIRWKYLHDMRGEVLITGYTSATEVKGVVLRRLTEAIDGYGTYRWSFGNYSPKYGWPGAVTFYEDRLYLGGGATTPQRFDGSKSGDYETFLDGPDDDDAVAFTLNADEVNVIRWMNAGRTLQIGTVGGEWQGQGGTANGPITPSSISVRRGTTYGSAFVQAKRVGNTVLFVTRSGRKVRELAYDFNVDTLVAPEMTLLAEHVTQPNGIVQIDYQQEPYSILWGVRGDGVLVGMTYERPQDVVAWHRHILGGSFSSGDPVVESIAIIPDPNGDHDQVWLQVKRTIDGNTVRYVEFMSEPFTAETAAEDAIFLDCALSYSGASTGTLSGLDHLEGESVYVWGDGAPQGPFTVSGGSITLTSNVTKAAAGLRYTSRIQTMRIEAGAADGTAQGKTKRLTTVTFRVWRSCGAAAGPDIDHLDAIPGMAAVATGDLFMRWPGGYEDDGHIWVQVRDPHPLTLVSIMPQLVTQDR